MDAARAPARREGLRLDPAAHRGRHVRNETGRDRRSAGAPRAILERRPDRGARALMAFPASVAPAGADAVVPIEEGRQGGEVRRGRRGPGQEAQLARRAQRRAGRSGGRAGPAPRASPRAASSPRPAEKSRVRKRTIERQDTAGRVDGRSAISNVKCGDDSSADARRGRIPRSRTTRRDRALPRKARPRAAGVGGLERDGRRSKTAWARYTYGSGRLNTTAVRSSARARRRRPARSPSPPRDAGHSSSRSRLTKNAVDGRRAQGGSAGPAHSSMPGSISRSRSSSPASRASSVAIASSASSPQARVSRSKSAANRPAGSAARSPTVTDDPRVGGRPAGLKQQRPQRLLVEAARRHGAVRTPVNAATRKRVWRQQPRRAAVAPARGSSSSISSRSNASTVRRWRCRSS